MKSCWKKIQNSRLSAVFVNNDNYDKQLVLRKYKDEKNYDIFVVEPHKDLLKPIFENKAKTKAQAVKIAKKYMKENC